MVIEVEIFEFPKLNPLNFCLWVCMKSNVQGRKVDTQNELLARIMDCVTRTKKH
jgi:hypothetical protein